MGAELFHAQITRAQGAFSPRQTIRVWALDYLAENIEAPAVTLHYPSRRELVRELRQGDYTHVGINFVVSTFHKVREMSELIRRYLPEATIILGGYGTVLPDEILNPYGDAICREEGVGYLRRLLGEPEGGPIRAPHAPIPGISVVLQQQPRAIGHVTAGLGCPNGCDFCCTSHFFKRRYQRFCETGRDVYEALIKTRERSEADGVPLGSYILIDEDFFISHRRAREFLDCVREGGEALSVMGFGSVRGLSKFTAREIAEMGFDMIWTAVEGKQAGYGKQVGHPLADLYTDLKAVGCATLSSMIIGFPYQDEATMRAEFEELMALNPALIQCLIYFAFPGTPFHEQVIAQERYRPEYLKEADLRRWDGFAMHFDHPQFDDPARIEELQREFYEQDFHRLGPSLLRLGRVWLTGYENLRNDPNPLLAARAEKLRETLRPLLPLARIASRHGPSPAARELCAELARDIERLTGAATWRERIEGSVGSLFYYLNEAALSAGYLQQPGLLRTVHRLPGEAESLHTRRIMELQGQQYTGLARVLAEDTWNHLRHAAHRLVPGLARPPFAPAETQMVTSRPCPLEASRQPRKGSNGTSRSVLPMVRPQPVCVDPVDEGELLQVAEQA